MKIDPSQESMIKILSFIEDKWRKYFPLYPFTNFFLEDLDKNLYLREIRFLKISGYLALLAIFICCLGIYGLISYFIQGKLKEISIRKVLGAGTRYLAVNISSGFIKSALIAIFFAVPITWFIMNRWLQNFVFRIQLNAGFFLLGTVIVLFFIMIPILPHIIRVNRHNPINFLREE